MLAPAAGCRSRTSMSPCDTTRNLTFGGHPTDPLAWNHLFRPTPGSARSLAFGHAGPFLLTWLQVEYLRLSAVNSRRWCRWRAGTSTRESRGLGHTGWKCWSAVKLFAVPGAAIWEMPVYVTRRGMYNQSKRRVFRRAGTQSPKGGRAGTAAHRSRGRTALTTINYWEEPEWRTIPTR